MPDSSVEHGELTEVSPDRQELLGLPTILLRGPTTTIHFISEGMTSHGKELTFGHKSVYNWGVGTL